MLCDIINIMEGKMNGKKGKGRTKDTNLRKIKNLLFLKSYKEVKKLTDKRVE